MPFLSPKQQQIQYTDAENSEKYKIYNKTDITGANWQKIHAAVSSNSDKVKIQKEKDNLINYLAKT